MIFILFYFCTAQQRQHTKRPINSVDRKGKRPESPLQCSSTAGKGTPPSLTADVQEGQTMHMQALLSQGTQLGEAVGVARVLQLLERRANRPRRDRLALQGQPAAIAVRKAHAVAERANRMCSGLVESNEHERSTHPPRQRGHAIGLGNTVAGPVQTQVPPITRSQRLLTLSDGDLWTRDGASVGPVCTYGMCAANAGWLASSML